MTDQEATDETMRRFGYDPEQLKITGEVLMKALIENHCLRARLALAERVVEQARREWLSGNYSASERIEAVEVIKIIDAHLLLSPGKVGEKI